MPCLDKVTNINYGTALGKGLSTIKTNFVPFSSLHYCKKLFLSLNHLIEMLHDRHLKLLEAKLRKLGQKHSRLFSEYRL